jgi:hypothetical protein
MLSSDALFLSLDIPNRFTFPVYSRWLYIALFHVVTEFSDCFDLRSLVSHFVQIDLSGHIAQRQFIRYRRHRSKVEDSPGGERVMNSARRFTEAKSRTLSTLRSPSSFLMRIESFFLPMRDSCLLSFPSTISKCLSVGGSLISFVFSQGVWWCRKLQFLARKFNI